jgi:hypothetical protein
VGYAHDTAYTLLIDAAQAFEERRAPLRELSAPFEDSIEDLQPSWRLGCAASV